MTIVVDLRVAEVATRTGAALEAEATEEDTTVEATTRIAGEITTGMEALQAVGDTTAASSLEAVTTITARAHTTRVSLDHLEATTNHSLSLTVKATTRATTTKGTTMATTVNTQDTTRATVKLQHPRDRPTTSSSRATINSTSSTLSSGSSTTRTRASGTSTITNTAVTATITSRAPKAARAPREHSSSSSIAAVSDGPFPKQHSSCLFCAPSLT